MSSTPNASGASSYADARSNLGSAPSIDSSSWNGDEATQTGDDLAAAKLWAVYISEAEKYDKALVERWKSDMEGLLIFAGLFSASLTAFLIESYKSLSPDQGAIMIALLERIAQQQLNASDPGITAQFTGPSTSSLACNTLWFLSLGLSLSCALIATLVQQWARDFLQNTEMRPAPIVRARIFSYLYFGLQRFGMHAMVEFIPFLLHLSLLLFFAGLVAFLLPINIVVTAAAGVILGLISVTYFSFTILPIISADSPYRTPLSSAVWAFFQRLSRLFRRDREALTDQESTLTGGFSAGNNTKIPTMMEVMVSKAVASSPKRDQRDAQVIVWTVRSLTDNEELEPFVEALPDLIWGPNGQRHSHDTMINRLLDVQDIQLIPRIEDLLRSCDSGLLIPEAEVKRRISCLKALWSLAYFIGSYTGPRDSFPHFDHNLLESQLNSKSTTSRIQYFAISASALARWIAFCAVSSTVQRALTTLRSKQSTPAAQDLRVIVQQVQQEAYSRGFDDFGTSLTQHISGDPNLLNGCQESLVSFELRTFDTLLAYMKSSAVWETAPYEFEATCKMMQVSDILWKHTDVRNNARDTLQEIIAGVGMPNDGTILHPVDIIVDMLLYSLGNDFGNPQAAKALAKYITYRPVGPGYNRALSRVNPNDLIALLTQLTPSDARMHWAMFAIWSLFVDGPAPTSCDPSILQGAFCTRQFFMSPALRAVVKTSILMASRHSPVDQMEASLGSLQISNMQMAEINGQWMAPIFFVLADFLEEASGREESRLAQTFDFFTPRCPVQRIPPSCQGRIARWFLALADGIQSELHQTIYWAFGRWLTHIEYNANFDDLDARGVLCQAFEAVSNLDRDADVDLRYSAAVVVANLSGCPQVDTNDPEESIPLNDSSGISKTKMIWLIWQQMGQTRQIARITSGSIMTRLAPGMTSGARIHF